MHGLASQHWNWYISYFSFFNQNPVDREARENRWHGRKLHILQKFEVIGNLRLLEWKCTDRHTWQTHMASLMVCHRAICTWILWHIKATFEAHILYYICCITDTLVFYIKIYTIQVWASIMHIHILYVLYINTHNLLELVSYIWTQCSNLPHSIQCTMPP